MRWVVKVWAKFLPLTLLASLLIGFSIPTIANAANCSATGATSGDYTIKPSHGSVFYIDSGISPCLDAAYVG